MSLSLHHAVMSRTGAHPEKKNVFARLLSSVAAPVPPSPGPPYLPTTWWLLRPPHARTVLAAALLR